MSFNKIKKATLLLTLLVLGRVWLFALDPPAHKGHFVVDQAAIIDSQTERELEQMLSALQASDGTAITVLTIPSLEGENLEMFSLRVAEKWKPGDTDNDNGVLLLVALQEKKIRIETGYGLEHLLTDLICGRIIDYEIKPPFQAGNFSEGIKAGVIAIIQVVEGEYEGKTTSKKKGSPLTTLLFVIILIILLSTRGGRAILFAFLLTGGSGRSRGGSGGGGFGGFSGGGGGFGGGGASGGW